MDPPPRLATLMEMVDALLLFDEPVLNRRFHEMLLRHPNEEVRSRLARLPGRVAKAERASREGSRTWMQAGGTHIPVDFVERGERALMESFLDLAENQIRIVTALVVSAPTREIRAHFEEGLEELRNVSGELREALHKARVHSLLKARKPHGLRSVQEEDKHGDLRSQVEDAIRRSREAGKEPRVLLLSPTGLRHLKDQGVLRQDETTVQGVPVSVDFGWDASAFALQTYDVVPLEELLNVPTDGSGEPRP